MQALRCAAICAAAAGAAISPAQAQSPEQFYAGKQLRFIIHTTAGGDYDAWARLLAKHMPKHIPGNPTFVVSNMHIASGLAMTNYMQMSAPRDGTVIGIGAPTAPLDEKLGTQARADEAAAE